MSDTFKLPEGILTPLEDTEEVVDEVIKDKDLQLQEVIEELEWVWEEHTTNHADAY